MHLLVVLAITGQYVVFLLFFRTDVLMAFVQFILLCLIDLFGLFALLLLMEYGLAGMQPFEFGFDGF